VSDTPWLIRRLYRHDGKKLLIPRMWGRVVASSATVAVIKYLNLANSGENRDHFDAIPSR
jgi:hypothetical protein